jgi:hypothetical protein
MIHRLLILGLKNRRRQGWNILHFLLLSVPFSMAVSGCSPKAMIDPPSTPPLTRSAIGYGVVTDSYIRVLDEPSNNGITLGYVREKTVLTILERRLVKERDTQRYWVLAEGTYRGWLPESSIKLYDTQDKAETAASWVH